MNVVLSIGQNEVDTTSERIKFVNEASIRQKKVIFGEANMPRGYKIGVVNGQKCMVKDPDQEELVNAFFDYFEKDENLAVSIDRAIRNAIRPDWKRNFQKQQNIRLAIYENLLIYGYDEDEATAETAAVFEITERQAEYDV